MINVKLLYEANDLMQIREEMKRVKNVKSIKIISAFITDCSKEDNITKKLVQDLATQYNIGKENFEIYLSTDFTPFHKKQTLEFLMQYASVYIIDNLHAKAYYIEGNPDLFAFGSSNFTVNGFEKNVELMGLCKKTSKKQIMNFIEYCQEMATLVTEDLLEDYEKLDMQKEKMEKNQEVLKAKKEMEKIQKKIQDKKFLFTESDYKVFASSNWYSRDSAIQNKRKRVQKKFKDIHTAIAPKLKKLNINLQPSKKITNDVYINAFNKSVHWIGVRYWYNFDKINRRKYADLQYCIKDKFFIIELFHATQKGAVDRKFLHKNIDLKKDKILKEFKKITKNVDNLQWIISSDTIKKDFVFDFKKTDAKNFIDFYKKYDKEGYYSELFICFDLDNKRLTKNNINKLIIDTFKLLMPLYLEITKNGEF